ncbi:MAG: hypothetical protein ACYC5A_11050 [Thermoleophilia bacterium]
MTDMEIGLDDIDRYFMNEAEKTFEFLVSEYGFSKPILSVNRRINFTFVVFMGRNIAIECILDKRERYVECKIALVENGEKTSHYAVDETGARVREGLFSYIKQRGVSQFPFEKIDSDDLKDEIRIRLEDYAQMLRQYGEEILKDSPAVFE